jgi:hypothetical protein
MLCDSFDLTDFTIQGSNLFYYNSREIFESDPSKTVKNRPVDLSGYSVAAHNADKPPYLLELLVCIIYNYYFYAVTPVI